MNSCETFKTASFWSIRPFRSAGQQFAMVQTPPERVDVHQRPVAATVQLGRVYLPIGWAKWMEGSARPFPPLASLQDLLLSHCCPLRVTDPPPQLAIQIKTNWNISDCYWICSALRHSENSSGSDVFDNNFPYGTRRKTAHCDKRTDTRFAFCNHFCRSFASRSQARRRHVGTDNNFDLLDPNERPFE